MTHLALRPPIEMFAPPTTMSMMELREAPGEVLERIWWKGERFVSAAFAWSAGRGRTLRQRMGKTMKLYIAGVLSGMVLAYWLAAPLTIGQLGILLCVAIALVANVLMRMTKAS